MLRDMSSQPHTTVRVVIMRVGQCSAPPGWGGGICGICSGVLVKDYATHVCNTARPAAVVHKVRLQVAC
jgi:hypothetical protein